MNDACELGRKVSNQPKSKRNKNDLVAVIKSKNNRGLGLSEDRKETISLTGRGEGNGPISPIMSVPIQDK